MANVSDLGEVRSMTVRMAARRLGCPEPKVRRMIASGQLTTVPATPIPLRGIGRPPSLLVSETDVERLRADELSRLAAVEPCDSTCPGMAVANDYGPVELVRLREEVAELRDALRLSLVIEAARADQLRLLLAERPVMQ